MLLAAEILLVLLLVCGSAFFSSAEMSLFSLPQARILACAADPDPGKRRIAFLMENYNRTLIAIILSNMFVNSCISMLSDDVIHRTGLSGIGASVVSALIAVVILLLFGEITPMTLAYAYCEKWSVKAAGPVAILRTLLFPLVIVVEKTTGFLLKLLGKAKSDPLTTEEYETYIRSCASRGAFSGEETEFLKEALEFSEMDVTEIMHPRMTLAFLRKDADAAEVVRTVRSRRRLYLIVGTETPDDAEYILSVRDFFALNEEDRKDWFHSKAVRRADFVPENTSIMLALRKLRENGVRACLVSDEYGGVAGMVVWETLVSRLTAQTLNVRNNLSFRPKRQGGSWLFDGLMSPDAAADTAGFVWTEELPDTNTLNGLFCTVTGSVPEKGDSAVFGGQTLIVEEVLEHRASRIRISPERHP